MPVASGGLNITTTAPTITQTLDVQRNVPAGDLTITGIEPGVNNNIIVIPVVEKQLTLSTVSPSVDLTDNIILLVDHVDLKLSLHSVTANVSSSARVSTGAGGGRYYPVLPPRKRRKARPKQVKEKLKQVIRKRLEFRPVDLNKKEIDSLARQVEILLQAQYALDELYRIAAVAKKAEDGKSIPGEQLSELQHAREVLIPVVDEVIKECIKAISTSDGTCVVGGQ